MKIKHIIVLILISFSVSATAGKLYYAKSFTSSQRSYVEKCYNFDNSFVQQVKSSTEIGDLLLTGMISQDNGPMFLTKTNAYGSWMEYSPLYCDFRSEEDKEKDAELKHQKNVEAARQKAKNDLEAQKKAELAKQRKAEIKQIEEQAAAEAKFLKNQQIKSEKQKQAAQKAKLNELASKYSNTAKICVKSDADRVKDALLSRLPSIHRPGAVHIEDQKITKIKFFETSNIMEVSYSFKLYTQSQFKSGLGSKSEPINMKSTQDINVKPYGRSSAAVQCEMN